MKAKFLSSYKKYRHLQKTVTPPDGDLAYIALHDAEREFLHAAIEYAEELTTGNKKKGKQ